MRCPQFRSRTRKTPKRGSTLSCAHIWGRPTIQIWSVAPTCRQRPIRTELDLDQEIKDRIVARLKRKFAGVRLEHLVASILRASDYEAVETAAGPDGGVDIVAGRGELGFGQPRLCVQVKARRGPVGLPEYDRLLGNLGTFSAEHGLLVSLGGFTKPVHDRNAQSFFKIRLWGSDELAQRLLETYEDLPVDIRTDVPLRDRKVLEEANAA